MSEVSPSRLFYVPTVTRWSLPPGSHSQAPSSPSAFSVTSSSSGTPDRARFPRGSSTRSTFHGGQLRDRLPAAHNGPPVSPSLSQHTTASLAATQRGNSTSLIGKITSKFVRRSVILRNLTQLKSQHLRLTCVCIVVQSSHLVLNLKRLS